jgi:hypothetical protein
MQNMKYTSVRCWRLFGKSKEKVIWINFFYISYYFEEQGEMQYIAYIHNFQFFPKYMW